MERRCVFKDNGSTAQLLAVCKEPTANDPERCRCKAKPNSPRPSSPRPMPVSASVNSAVRRLLHFLPVLGGSSEGGARALILSSSGWHERPTGEEIHLSRYPGR